MNSKYLKCGVYSALLILFFTLTACSGGGDGIKHVPAKEHGTTSAYNSAYICPMHCAGSGSDKSGLCPGCGMDYVELASHTKNGHTH